MSGEEIEMKKVLAVVLVAAFAFGFSGCGKKQEPIEIGQEPMSMEAISNMTAVTPAPEAKSTEVKPPIAPQAPVTTSVESAAAASIKPTTLDIQTALKNAGFDPGSIDGKIGPKTKKAVEDFQKANGLDADGKVGPKTWAALSKYLSVQAPTGQKR
jgi:peptidoglycan hydrolase-like protein with peptidoglycan-binding domain